MRFITALTFLATAAFAAAQTTTVTAPSANPTCAADYILKACKKTIQSQIDDCTSNDFVCLCDQYTNLLTCFNNCPNDLLKPSVQNQVTQYCLAAAPAKASISSVLKTAKSVSVPTSTASVTGSGSGAEKPAITGFAGEEETPKGSATGAAKATGAAVPVYVPQIGGVLAVLGAVAGLM